VTNAPTTPWGLPWGLPGAPSDAYFARGYLGQFLIIVPSHNLIVVRFGASHGPGGDVEGVGALVRDVIATLH
jgi:CubicO group peptidase (beta-lactamase class C family)